MDLNEIVVFIQVVQAGSFSAAAKRLGMPNSTVSHKISALEKRLRVTLIQRTTRKLQITPEGLAYYTRCLQGLNEISSAEQELAAVQGEPLGLLRITAPVELGYGVLPKILSAFAAKYPKLGVEAIMTDRRVDLLAENVDLAIRAGRLKDSSLIAKKIGSVYFRMVASPSFLKKWGAPTHPRELKNFACVICTPLGKDRWNLVGPRGGATDFAVGGRFMANDFATVTRFAELGEGIALLPSHYIYSQLVAGDLMAVLPEWRTTTSALHFVYPAQRFVVPKISAFIQFANAKLAEAFRVNK